MTHSDHKDWGQVVEDSIFPWSLKQIIKDVLTLLWLGGALCARQIFEDIFLHVFVKNYGLIVSDF